MKVENSTVQEMREMVQHGLRLVFENWEEWGGDMRQEDGP
jgi:hypothetical protein